MQKRGRSNRFDSVPLHSRLLPCHTEVRGFDKHTHIPGKPNTALLPSKGIQGEELGESVSRARLRSLEGHLFQHSMKLNVPKSDSM